MFASVCHIKVCCCSVGLISNPVSCIGAVISEYEVKRGWNLTQVGHFLMSNLAGVFDYICSPPPGCCLCFYIYIVIFHGIQLVVTVLSHRCNSRADSEEAKVKSHASSETQPTQASWHNAPPTRKTAAPMCRRKHRTPGDLVSVFFRSICPHGWLKGELRSTLQSSWWW